MNIQTLLLARLSKRGLRKKSKETYESKIKIFCEYLSKYHIYRLSRITKKVAENFLETVSTSPTTRNAYRDTLRSFFKDLVKDKLIKVNPFAEIAKHKESRQGKMFFNEDQVIQLSQEIERSNPVLWMACKMLYYCFIRNTEQSNLAVYDIQHEDAIIRLHGSFSKNHKTESVLIPDEFINSVQSWRKQQIEAGFTHFFTNHRGQKICRGDWFTKQHAAILKRLGYSNRYSFYSWKHTGAVHFYKATKDLKALQLQLRHHSLDQVDEYLREFGIIENDGIRCHRMAKPAMAIAA